MIPSPAKCRRRIRALRSWIAACPPDKPGEKGSNRKLLLYGVVPSGYDLDRWMRDDVDGDDAEPLDMVESMTLDTWFYQYPGKVCGKEVLTTSREFPLTIKGTREDCERVFEQYLGPLGQRTTTTQNDEEATAALALMQMLELEMEAGLSGASSGSVTYYQINDTLATIHPDNKGGKRMYHVQTFRAWMPPFLVNCELPNTNAAWFLTVRQCKRHVDEIDVLNYYAFSEESVKADAAAWLRTHPHRTEGIFELDH